VGKERNLLETVQITVSTNPLIRDLLDKLVLTGFYGNSRAEAAERLLAESLKRISESSGEGSKSSSGENR
jgi:hypothetical protein